MISSQSSMSAAPRRRSIAVDVGGVRVGGDAPIVVQSMTNTDTADVVATAKQTAELARAGSELVRITVNTPEAAKAVPHIRERLDMMGVGVPLIGDFHYNGHQLLAAEPACARGAGEIPHQSGQRRLRQEARPAVRDDHRVRACVRKPVRIGVNWGSLDQSMVAALMDENAQRADPWDAADVAREALIRSALDSAAARRGTWIKFRSYLVVLQGVWRAGTDRGLSRSRRAAATTRCIWA